MCFSTVLRAGPVDSRGSCSPWRRPSAASAQQIQASGDAFGAILHTGSVLAWGNSRDGADGCAVQYQLQNVLPIQASYETYATILGDGSFTALGIGRFTNKAAAVQYRTSCEMRSRSKLTRGICSKFGAMDQSSPGAVPVLVTLAILGSRKMCNRSKLRGVHLLQSYALEIVLQIQASLASFAAILGGASVLTWARARFGGDSTSLQEQLRDCSHSKLHMLHSLQSCAMDLSSPTTVPALLMTVQYRSSRECATVPGFQWRVGCNPGYWSMSCRSRLVRPAANVRPLYNLHCGTCCNPG